MVAGEAATTTMGALTMPDAADQVPDELFNDDQLEALGIAADRAVWKTIRRPKTYHAGDTYRYADADLWEREENISVGRQIVAALDNVRAHYRGSHNA